jgi:UDP-glucose 4-epimerase
MSGRFLIIGGAGFIGSHFIDRLLTSPTTATVTVYDNFSSGRTWHFGHRIHDCRLKIVKGAIHDFAALKRAMARHDTVIHLASNPDIARAVTEPDIDFREGTQLTERVVEAMRQTGTKTILYASGSGVYGELGEVEANEDHGPMVPVSTYGASKLAGEALIASYAHMFDLRGLAFRFGNVVGRRQTHGVGFDFVRRLLKDPTRLRILGDGKQSKSYVWVGDVVSGVLLAHEKSTRPFEAFNVATGDYITVTEIANVACECLDISPKNVRYDYTGGDRGWKGDVPVVRLNTDRIRGLGWRPTHTSREALRQAMLAMLADIRSGLDPAGTALPIGAVPATASSSEPEAQATVEPRPSLTLPARKDSGELCS